MPDTTTATQLGLMPSYLIGHMGPFTEKEEEFETYISRMELYFSANGITEDKKVPVFLTIAGSKIYTLAKNLLPV